MAHPRSVSIVGSEAAADLARLWVRATAHRLGKPLPVDPEPERVEALAKRIGRPGAAGVLAAEDGVALACCFFEPLTEEDGETPIPGGAHLSGVAVEPACWGEGLATAVVGFAVSEVRRRGYDRLRLHVLEVNVRARSLYEHLGWRLVATGHPHRAGPQAVYDKALAPAG